MQEILFRGKRKDNRQWVYGYYAIQEDGTTVILKPYKEHVDRRGNGDYWSQRFGQYEVDLETVGQYISLEDRNGNKIFSNHKIKELETDTIYEIIFEKGRYNLKGFCNTQYEYPTEAFSEGMSDFEIVED